MVNEIKKREKSLTELGVKSRTGILMCRLFRAVASEKTELISTKVPGSKNGKMQTLLVSKAEAIVRDIVQKALPSKSGTEISDEGKMVAVDPKVQMEYRKMVLDRVDGRAGTVGEDVDDKGTTIPDRISEASKGFLNAQAGKAGKKSGPPTVKKKG